MLPQRFETLGTDSFPFILNSPIFEKVHLFSLIIRNKKFSEIIKYT